MKYSLGNPPIDKVQEYTNDIKNEFQIFDAKVKKLVLVHDFTYQMKGFENKVLMLTLGIFFIGIVVFMGWFYTSGPTIRAEVAAESILILTSTFGIMILAVIGSVRSMKSYTAYLIRRDIQRLTRKSMRQTKNIANFIDNCLVQIDGKQTTKDKEIAKTLKKVSEDFDKINDLFSHYQGVPSIPILSIGSLIASILAIPFVYQTVASLSDPQMFYSFFQPVTLAIFLAFFIGFFYHLLCKSRKENIGSIFELQESEKKLSDSLDQLNRTLVGEDLTNLFSDSLLVFHENKT
jgi:hypothetical protein